MNIKASSGMSLQIFTGLIIAERLTSSLWIKYAFLMIVCLLCCSFVSEYVILTVQQVYAKNILMIKNSLEAKIQAII